MLGESEPTSSKSTFPSGSQRIHLISSTASSDGIHQGSSLGMQLPEFLLGAKLSRKENIQHNAH